MQKPEPSTVHAVPDNLLPLRVRRQEIKIRPYPPLRLPRGDVYTGLVLAGSPVPHRHETLVALVERGKERYLVVARNELVRETYTNTRHDACCASMRP